MSQRFIRCGHCGMPHDVMQVICPATGKAIRRDKERHAPSEPPPRARADKGSPSTIPPKQRDLIGKTIGGKYVVRSVLGEGGMGTVFEAEHMTLGRSVAVKVLHPNQARKKDAVRRFHQEARAAGAIGHPNICEVYDLGTLDEGSPYLVMEKLVGETLADRIAAEGGLPFDDVIDILVQVLSGLVAAHEKGIVHRDIKPENVFLTKRVGCPPVCKLLDFGVSKMISPLLGGRDEDLDLTRTGMVMGTPYYMSPEQARGDRNLDARVDLYACGVILYEALTGRRPFTAANYNALLLQILGTSPRPARELRPALPGGFDAVIEKAMARSRDDRYRTANDFQRDLQGLRDRHNTPSIARLGDALRAMAPAPAKAVLGAPAAGASRARRPSPLPPMRDLSDSSVEIPITVAGETPLSGENLPVEATELESRPRLQDAAEFEEYPTQVQSSPFDDRPEDAHTTDRRGPELAHQLAQVRSGIRDTDVTGRPAVSDTEPTGRQVRPQGPIGGANAAGARTAPPRRAPAEPREPREPRDDQDTIIRSGSSFPMAKRKTRKTPSADDTVKVEGEIATEGDPTQLMASRAPKAPRR